MRLAEYLIYIPFALSFAQIAYTDWAEREIPNKSLLLMLACGIAACFLPGSMWIFDLSCTAGMVVFCLILWLIHNCKLSAGDLKLLPVITLWLGLNDLLLVLTLALALIGITNSRQGNRQKSTPQQDKKPTYPFATCFFLAWLIFLPLL
jgi:Flp pilus assembly protein protease CpaA